MPRAAAEVVHLRIDLETDGGRCGRQYFEETIGLRDRARAAYAAVLGCDASRGGADRLDHRRREHGDRRPRPAARRRDRDLRPGASRAARAAGPGAPSARGRRSASCRSPRSPARCPARPGWSPARMSRGWAARWPTCRRWWPPAFPVLLDAAQALGAVPVDVHALGCDFYAASGQKWLCGPEGSGCLFVRPDRLDDLLVPWPGYASLADARRCARFRLGPGHAAGSTTGSRSECATRGHWPRSACSRRRAGTGCTHARPTLAAWLAERLSERGLEVRARGTINAGVVED